MKFNSRDFARRGILYAPDDAAGGGGTGDASVQTSAETAAGSQTESQGAAGAAAGAGTGTATVSMTKEDFDAAIARASTQALADQRAEQERAQREVQAREAEQRRRQASAAASNPQMDALEAMDLRTDMLEEALLLHPDMPIEARQQLKEDLRSFKTVDQVRAAKDSGLHVKLADAAAGSAIRAGKYTPKNLQASAAAVTREPAHSEPQRQSVPDWYKREMESEFASMGLKITDKEIEEAYRSDAR